MRPAARWFLVALALLCLASFGLGLRRANRTSLRGDEIVTLHQNVRGQPLGDLLLRGAHNQVSPAPLHYVVDKAVDALRVPLGWLGLTPPGYARLPSLLFTAGLGFAAGFVVFLRLRREEAGWGPFPLVLVLCAVGTFVFHPKVFAFAGTDRPYGLWNGLWFLSMAWLIGRPPAPRVPLALFCLMAATASAACFQLAAVGVAVAVIRRPWKEALLVLGPPVLIGACYALRSAQATYEEATVGEKAPHFLQFWLLSNAHVWIAGGAACVATLARPKWRELAIPPAALAAMVLLMPVIFLLAHAKGYSMVSRQYIWTSTAVPLALFVAAFVLPASRLARPARVAFAAAAVALVVGNGWAALVRPPRNDSRELALLEQLRSERPAGFLPDAEMGSIERGNLGLLAEWVGPAGTRDLAVRDVQGRLVGEWVEARPGTAGRIPVVQ